MLYHIMSALEKATEECFDQDGYDDLLAGAIACSGCLSHLPLLSGYDEPKTLSYQITLFGPIGADVRQVAIEALTDAAFSAQMASWQTSIGANDEAIHDWLASRN